jgi:hypothetical protein
MPLLSDIATDVAALKASVAALASAGDSLPGLKAAVDAAAVRLETIEARLLDLAGLVAAVHREVTPPPGALSGSPPSAAGTASAAPSPAGVPPQSPRPSPLATPTP